MKKRLVAKVMAYSLSISMLVGSCLFSDVFALNAKAMENENVENELEEEYEDIYENENLIRSDNDFNPDNELEQEDMGGEIDAPAVIELEELPEVNANNFSDISENAYYYKAVLWAVEKGITSGTGPNKFSPNASCTRGQTVTFLWRAMDCPEPTITENPFVDINESDYYYKAVLWAYEKGITSGVDKTHFGPGATVTRGQFVTFLWRTEGSPVVGGSNFEDVPANEYYAMAVSWAAKNGITSGTSAKTFSPLNSCTRGQVVTFLYRWKTAVNVTSFGATPNDATDDTAAFNKAVDEVYANGGGTIVVPDGTFIINAVSGINLKSNITLAMGPNTVLDIAATNSGIYDAIRIRNERNITISGGTLSGERNKHLGQNGEWGMGIGIYDGIGITISGMTIKNNWGDGIYLGTTQYGDTLFGCDNIKILGCTISDNRRSNISIVDANNVTIEDCKIANAKGTAPQCGIDIEPNADSSGRIPADAICDGITIKNTTIDTVGKDDYYGQFFCFMTVNYPDNSIITCKNLYIENCNLNGDCGNYSGANAKIKDSVIRGTFYDEQHTILENVKYENIWRN